MQFEYAGFLCSPKNLKMKFLGIFKGIKIIVDFLITFRETLEAALIVGIILAYLYKTKNTKYNKVIYSAVGAGLVGSILAAFIFNIFLGSFTGKSEQIFEGAAMLIGSFLITTHVFWMMSQKNIAADLKEKVHSEIKQKDMTGLFLLTFVAVLREGVETVLFLGAASYVNQGNRLLAGSLGVLFAIFLGYLLFVASVKIDIKKFFNASSILLVLFAAGLAAHGVHELQEAQILPTYIEHVWDINPKAPLAEQGVYPVLHENGVVGSLAKGLFGYNGNPSLLEVLTYIIYILAVFLIYKTLKTSN